MVAATRQSGQLANGFCWDEIRESESAAATASLCRCGGGTESAAKSSQWRRKRRGTAMRNARIKGWTQDLRSIVYYEPEVSRNSLA